MKSKIKLFLFVFSFVSVLTFPVRASAAHRNTSAYNFTYQFANNSPWVNLARAGNHADEFLHASYRLNQVSGVNNRLVGQIRDARIVARTNTDSTTWWGLQTGGSGGSTIEINFDRTRLDGFTTNNYRWLALHEFGHAYGLKHQPASAQSVMRTGIIRSMSDLGRLDRENLNWR